MTRKREILLPGLALVPLSTTCLLIISALFAGQAKKNLLNMSNKEIF